MLQLNNIFLHNLSEKSATNFSGMNSAAQSSIAVLCHPKSSSRPPVGFVYLQMKYCDIENGFSLLPVSVWDLSHSCNDKAILSCWYGDVYFGWCWNRTEQGVTRRGLPSRKHGVAKPCSNTCFWQVLACSFAPRCKSLPRLSQRRCIHVRISSVCCRHFNVTDFLEFKCRSVPNVVHLCRLWHRSGSRSSSLDIRNGRNPQGCIMLGSLSFISSETQHICARSWGPTPCFLRRLSILPKMDVKIPTVNMRNIRSLHKLIARKRFGKADVSFEVIFTRTYCQGLSCRKVAPRNVKHIPIIYTPICSLQIILTTFSTMNVYILGLALIEAER